MPRNKSHLKRLLVVMGFAVPFVIVGYTGAFYSNEPNVFYSKAVSFKKNSIIKGGEMLFADGVMVKFDKCSPHHKRIGGFGLFARTKHYSLKGVKIIGYDLRGTLIVPELILGDPVSWSSGSTWEDDHGGLSEGPASGTIVAEHGSLAIHYHHRHQ